MLIYADSVRTARRLPKTAKLFEALDARNDLEVSVGVDLLS